jgi:23S rRNA (uracil-5-)-methyltransferase RumA
MMDETQRQEHDMREPLCPYFKKCGGCAFQDVDYKVQLENKRDKLSQALRFEEISIFSGRDYHYRQRMDMVFHPEGLGFREKGSWRRIVDVEECVISNEELNGLIREIRQFFHGVDAFDNRTHAGTFRFAVMRTPPSDSAVSIVLNKDSDKLEEAQIKVKDFAKKISARNVLITYVTHDSGASISDEYEIVKGSDMLQETYAGFTFKYHIQGFFQNNHDMAENLHKYCHDLLKSYPTQDAHLLDLYGGVGTFGIINAGLFKDVTILESYEPAIHACEKNIEENGLSNVKPILMDAKHLKILELQEPLYAILDPPRSGMNPRTLKRLNEIQPERIVFISCNVKLLRRELPYLSNYRIESAALFDLFPQTPHQEAVIELVPIDKK